MDEYDDELRKMFNHRDEKRAEDAARAKAEAQELNEADIIYLDESQYRTVTNLDVKQRYNNSQKRNTRTQNVNRPRSRARYSVPKGTFQSKKKSLKPHQLLYIVACALSFGTLVHALTPKTLETNSLSGFINNPIAVSEAGVSYDSLQSLKEFADEYKDEFDKGNFSEDFLEENYSKYRELAEDIFKSKISQATGVSQDLITITRPFPRSELTVGYRDTAYNGPETVVAARFNDSDERLPSSILSVALPLFKSIELSKEVSPFGVCSNAQIKNEAKLLYGYIEDLINFSQMQVVYEPLSNDVNSPKTLQAFSIELKDLEQENNISTPQSDREI